MTNAKERPRPLRGWPLFWLIATIGVLTSLARYAVRTQQLRVLRDEVATRHAHIAATHRALAEQLSATPDVRAREATLQAAWHLVGPNEQAVRVIPAATPTPRPAWAQVTPVGPTPMPPWRWWWLLFFGPVPTASPGP
ncbi:MAG: hypothetical protein GXO54_06845 [Chloroflexi bacterium]|nr:hypothetical protein [Chloroflexota bacterium]